MHYSVRMMNSDQQKIERLEIMVEELGRIINAQALEIRRLREQLISEQDTNDNLLYLHTVDHD